MGRRAKKKEQPQNYCPLPTAAKLPRGLPARHPSKNTSTHGAGFPPHSYLLFYDYFYVIFTCFCAQQDPEGAAGLGLLSPEGQLPPLAPQAQVQQLPAPVPQPYSITPRARGKCLFSPPDLGGCQVKLQTDRAADTEFLESACPKTRVPAVWHSWQTNWDRARARMAGQGWRCARWRGLPTFGSLSESRSKQSLWGVPSSCCWTRSRRASHRRRAPELAPNPAPSLPELTAGNENDPSLYKPVTHRDQEGLWQRLVTSSDSSCQAVRLLQQGLWLSPRSWESLAPHW